MNGRAFYFTPRASFRTQIALALPVKHFSTYTRTRDSHYFLVGSNFASWHVTRQWRMANSKVSLRVNSAYISMWVFYNEETSTVIFQSKLYHWNVSCRVWIVLESVFLFDIRIKSIYGVKLNENKKRNSLRMFSY